MNKFLKNLVVAILLFSLSVAQASAAREFPAELEEFGNELKADIEDGTFESCRENLIQAYDIETLKFLNFLEATFQNKSNNSTLKNIAIARYREYKEEINRLFREASPESSSGSDVLIQAPALVSYIECQRLTAAYTDLAKEHLIRSVKNSTSQKKTTIMSEKYQAIGNRLRDLNLDMAEMYSHFETFRNKLPGFLTKCVVK